MVRPLESTWSGGRTLRAFHSNDFRYRLQMNAHAKVGAHGGGPADQASSASATSLGRVLTHRCCSGWHRSQGHAASFG